MYAHSWGICETTLKRFLSLPLFLWLALCLQGCGFFGARMENAPKLASADKIVKTAYSQVGKKYCPGGDSPHKGFDCSGLVWWSYRQHGVSVPRITTEQAAAGKKIPVKLAKAGDIMVFRVSQSPRGLHTGIYAGNGAFIHSPSSGKKVCMEKIEPYWSGKLIAIRRVPY